MLLATLKNTVKLRAYFIFCNLLKHIGTFDTIFLIKLYSYRPLPYQKKKNSNKKKANMLTRVKQHLTNEDPPR